MDGGAINAVNGVNLSLGKGETLGVVGESGCGKSVTMSTILRLVKTPPARIEGEIYYKGQNILDMPMRDFTRIRATGISPPRRWQSRAWEA